MAYGQIPSGVNRVEALMAYNPTAFHNCPNCGAPVRGSSCPYCRTAFVRRPDAPNLSDLNPFGDDCPNCGGFLEVSTLRGMDGRVVARYLFCERCDWNNTHHRLPRVPPPGKPTMIRR